MCPKANKSAIRSYKLHEKARKKLVGEGEEPSPSIFFSILLGRLLAINSGQLFISIVYGRVADIPSAVKPTRFQ